MASQTQIARGALCVSIDLELAWGVWDVLTPEGLDLAARLERPIVEGLLKSFATYKTPATWAIVSGMLCDEATRGRQGDRRAWRGDDLLDRVRSASPTHDIGSHSYAHVYYDRITPDEAARDLRAARAVHDRDALPFASFVFPRNAVGHLDALAREGARVFRSTDAGPLRALGRVSKRLRQAANLVDKALPFATPLILPRRHANGLVELESSLLLMSRRGPRKLIPPAALRAKARRALREAARQRKVFHVWFHPSNFYYDGETQLATLDAILREAADLRDRGVLDVRTMASFADA